MSNQSQQQQLKNLQNQRRQIEQDNSQLKWQRAQLQKRIDECHSAIKEFTNRIKLVDTEVAANNDKYHQIGDAIQQITGIPRVTE